MHLSSSFAVILCTFLFSQYVYCSPKRDERWWRNLTGLETRQRSQWTTLDSKLKTTPKVSNHSSTQKSFLKRSGITIDDDMTDSPVRTRSRNWEKSYARRRDYDRTWKDDQPIRERFSETEWDDDVPVRHVFRDSTSSIDEGPTRNRFGDELPRERMSRPWSRGDSNWSDTFGRNNNKNNRNNINSNIKPKVSTTTSQQPKSDRSDRILNLNFQDADSKRKDKERLDKLAKQIFGTVDDENESIEVIPRGNSNSFNGRSNTNNGRNNGNSGNGINGRSNGSSGNGYVRNAMNTFTRNPGNTYATTGSDFPKTTGNDLNRNIGKQTSNRFTSNTNNKDVVKPKFNIETTPAKPEKTSNTAKPNIANDIRGVAEKPKSSTTPSAPLQFGWRSSVGHSNDTKKQNLQNSVNEDNVSTDANEDEEEDDFVDEFAEEFDETTTKAPTRATTRTTSRTVIRTTVKPTTMRAGVEYTTNKAFDTTRPQTSTSVTNKPIREPTVITTSRPKSTTNDLSDNLAPNKKQHRMGSWVDSETLDYVEGDNEADNWSNGDSPPAEVNGPQPLIGEEEFDEEQFPERVEEAPLPIQPIPPPSIESDAEKFARQSAREDEDQESGRLEDALPGVPGTDYPTFATIPRTNFDCKTHEWPGYYADVEAQCQVFHICQTGGRKNSFLCPNGTMFNQQIFVCDWWHNVQCGDSATYYQLNENIYDNNWESKRVGPNIDERTVRRSGSLESAEPLKEATTEIPEVDSESNSDSTDSLEKRNDLESTPIDDSKDDFVEENNGETTKSQLTQRNRSPIRIYRTSRIITDPDRQKRRRRKRGYLKN